MDIKKLFRNFIVLAILLFFLYGLIWYIFSLIKVPVELSVLVAAIALGVFYGIVFKEPMPRATMLKVTTSYTVIEVVFVTLMLYTINTPAWIIALVHGMTLFLSFLVYLTMGISNRMYLRLIKKNSSLLRRTLQ
ncbi:MAG: hypothetical protein WC471_00895 [Candidatus Woesearchaeota archaeon]